MKKKENKEILKAFVNEKKGYYIVSIALAIVSVIFGMIPYLFIGKMVNLLIVGNASFDDYLIILCYMSFCWIGKELFHAFSTSISHIATFEVLANLREATLNKLSKVPLGIVKDTPSGTFKNIIVERIDSIETTLAHVVPEFTSNLLAPFIMFVVLWMVDWRIALLSIITLPITFLLFGGMMIGYEARYKNAVDKTKILNDTAVEYINGIEVIKVFGKAKTSYEKFVVAVKEGASCYVDWMRSCNGYHSAIMSIAPCTLIGVLPIGAYFVYTGSLSQTDFILCLILSIGLIAPLVIIMSYSDDIAKIDTVLGEVTTILLEKELIRPDNDQQKVQHYDIELKNVRFAYHEKEVLHNISMKLEEGRIHALVGPSGSGKSTIAKLIASLWDVNDGEICIGGIPIQEISFETFHQLIAYVSQDTFLFDVSVKENIRIGNPNASDEMVYQVAKQCGCYDFIMQLENGFDTVVGTAGSHLSGGEKQRISIARAMLKDAPIIILDEATAYTDPENEALIQSSLAKLIKGKTLLVIAHRLSTVINSDCIYVIEDGCVVDYGTHADLLKQCVLYKQMWESHVYSKDLELGGMTHA